MNRPKQRFEVMVKSGHGSPAWVVTFADMILLLMAFFILMFAYSEIDKVKYKGVVAAMHSAFGGKKPAGDSVENIKIIEKEKIIYVTKDNPLASSTIKVQGGTGNSTDKEVKNIAKTASDVSRLKKALSEEVNNKQIEIEQRGQMIIVRLLGDHAFESGSAELLPETLSTLQGLALELQHINGTIVVSGYTDNKPVNSHIYRSNWELSAARAFSVIQEFMEDGIDPERLTLRGFGDTRPIAPNNTPENRALNRRVEIAIDQQPQPAKVEILTQQKSVEPEKQVPRLADKSLLLKEPSINTLLFNNRQTMKKNRNILLKE